ncbi:hypothetical protein [Paenibacillus sp. SYP-B4298]|uniref:hypothetical protein n=1 Tax=Paenibacillus sp. SYP-B4298 TaxID=2996034 RepID=UPI0022DE0E05|nr:hypothetical protein [Paenibacillus sp. SYP-B4298]
MRTRRSLVGYRAKEVSRYVHLLETAQESLQSLLEKEEAEFKQIYEEKWEHSLALREQLKSLLQQERQLAGEAGS